MFSRVGRVFFLTLVWLLLHISAAGGQTTSQYDDLTMHTLAHSGVPRRVGVYQPPNAPAVGAPLIVALHGRFSSAKALHALSNLRVLADAYGALLIYPEADGPFWTGAMRLNRTEAPTRDDLGFIAATVGWAEARFQADPAQVYVVGYDVGGVAAYMLECSGLFPIAGVAAVSALPWSSTLTNCAPGSVATRMLMVHGERDPIFPTRGLDASGAYLERRLGVRETVEFWSQHGGCPTQPQSRDRNGSVIYTQCRSGGSVAFVEVDGGEHDWFRNGPAYRLNRQGVDSTSLIGDFFFSDGALALPEVRGGGDRARSYFVYVPPAYEASTPTPVLLVLHGRPQSATGIALDTQMNPIAAREGFIVVYPQGLNNEWNSFLDLIRRRTLAPQDDEAFLKDVVEDLSVDLNIDRRRVYVTGFSNGGFMTIRLACTSSNFFAGFAAVGAGLYSELTGRCRGRQTPFLLIHGTGDESVPYTGVVQADGQGGEPTRISLGAQDTVAFFIRRNGCSLRGQSARMPQSSQDTFVVRFAPYDCAAGAEVMFYVVNGGAHNWPGSGTGPEPETSDIRASEVIWDFLRTHSLDEAAGRP